MSYSKTGWSVLVPADPSAAQRVWRVNNNLRMTGWLVGSIVLVAVGHFPPLPRRNCCDWALAAIDHSPFPIPWTTAQPQGQTTESNPIHSCSTTPSFLPSLPFLLDHPCIFLSFPLSPSIFVLSLLLHFLNPMFLRALHSSTSTQHPIFSSSFLSLHLSPSSPPPILPLPPSPSLLYNFSWWNDHSYAVHSLMAIYFGGGNHQKQLSSWGLYYHSNRKPTLLPLIGLAEMFLAAQKKLIIWPDSLWL